LLVWRIQSGIGVLLCALLVGVCLGATGTGQPDSPQIVSIFPAGGRLGSSLEIEIEGTGLDGVYSAWFGAGNIRGQIRNLEQIQLEELPATGPRRERKKYHAQRASVTVQVDAAAAMGRHWVRLVSPRGVSNALPFLVYSDPVVLETESPHASLGDAQRVPIPVVASGKIGKEGEVDYYCFDAAAGQDLKFEAFGRISRDPLVKLFTGRHFEVQLALYEPGPSWFDPSRARRLAIKYLAEYDDAVTTMRYRFGKAGRYYLAVSAMIGVAGPNYAYQLLISPDVNSYLVENRGRSTERMERAFVRKLDAGRLETLLSRTVLKNPAESVKDDENATGNPVGSAAGTPPSIDRSLLSNRTLTVTVEQEPNDTPKQALPLTLPALVEGAIGRPGDTDHFRFQAKRGQRLAFEIETPGMPPPAFGPRLALQDANGEEELFTNVYRFIGGDGDDWIKRIEPKGIYTFEREGAYLLQVRDHTSRKGGPGFQYRILIRPQIPHMGKIEVQEDRMNLTRGQARKLTVVTEQEEAFAGDISLAVENLPPGVQAFPGTEVEPEKTPPPLSEGNKDLFLPKSQKAVILLAASPEAPATRMPQFIRVTARPVVGGEIGAPSLVEEIPLMVVEK